MPQRREVHCKRAHCSTNKGSAVLNAAPIAEVIQEPLPLKPKIFEKKTVVFGKNAKMDLNRLWTEDPWKTKDRNVLVNPFSRFTKTTEFFIKILGLKSKGFLNDSPGPAQFSHSWKRNYSDVKELARPICRYVSEVFVAQFLEDSSGEELARPICRFVSEALVAQVLEDSAGDFPGVFLWYFFSSKIKGWESCDQSPAESGSAASKWGITNGGLSGPYPQYGWDFPEEIPEVFRERPRKCSQSVSWNSPRKYGWDPPNPILQGIWGFRSISRILSPQSCWGRCFFQKWYRRGPLRAGYGIPSSTEGISD